MKNATPDSARKYWSYAKKIGLSNPVVLLNSIKQAHEQKKMLHKPVQQHHGPPKAIAGTGGFKPIKTKRK